MIFNPVKFIAFIFIILAWIIMTFFFIGCANAQYRTIPNAMCEDSQNYSTKYNIMDSQDGSQNPNAQINIFSIQH